MRKRVARLLFFQVLLLPVLAAGQESPVLVLKSRIALANVSGRMDHLGVDLKVERLFAAAFDNHIPRKVSIAPEIYVHLRTPAPPGLHQCNGCELSMAPR